MPAAAPITQQRQKEVISLLDKMIEQLEQQIQQSQASGGGSGGQTSMPMQDSMPGGVAGQGKVENKKLAKTGENWGKLPEKEKVKALEAVNRQLPPHIREATEGFTKKLNEGGSQR